jgi:ATP-dependent exoDNAse (exonuclease V) alpha subunit
MRSGIWSGTRRSLVGELAGRMRSLGTGSSRRRSGTGRRGPGIRSCTPHVLVANLTLGSDGRWSTLDARRIYAHAKTAGYLYEARLRALVTRELGVHWTAVRNGIGDVAGVSPAMLRAFSRRRADIEAELERRGASSAAAAQVATLATRRGKDYRVTPEQLVPEWRARAAQLGLTPKELRGIGSDGREVAVTAELVDAISEDLAGPDGLTRQRSTFTRRDVVQAFCEALPAGGDVSAAEVERLADAFLASDRVVVLAVGEARRDVLRRADGRLVPTVTDERVYSTPELLARERTILDHAERTRGARAGVARQAAVDRALRRRPTISGEQAVMVRRLALDGDGVAVVVGEAGTGKTFALAAAREAWESSGRRVIGAALAQRAARELEVGAGIESSTIASLLMRLREEPWRALPRRAVLVVDEAGMVSTRELAELFEHAARVEAKVVLVGDHRQLSEIDAGGALKALAARLPVIELHENRRQVEAWERDALAVLRSGDARQALESFDRRGRVVVGETADQVRARLVEDWWGAEDRDGAAMIAFRRADVADLNGRARALMRATGALGQAELVVGQLAFAVGDHVVLRRNDRRLGVANGDRGVVLDLVPGADSMLVGIEKQRVWLPPDYLERAGAGPAVAHGYAITGHSAQGLTCSETFVLASSEASREWIYTAMSRGRTANRLYAVEDDVDDRLEIAPRGAGRPREVLASAIERSTAQTLACDSALRERIARQLADLARARQEAESGHARATRKRQALQESRPGTLRWRARAQHERALAAAFRAENAARQRAELYQQREAELRQRLQPRVPGRDAARAIERRRSIGRGGIER